MNFNSIAYLFFLPAALALFVSGTSRRRRFLLLVLSYFFYMNWSASYALLILASTAVTFYCGILVADRPRHRRLWMALSFLFNLGLLIFFKYFNFLAASASSMLALFGVRVQDIALSVLLPVGISFYTFQALGYTVDVYRGDVPCERDFVTYALFVSFFPQLVAGPIERSANLLPQLHALDERVFSWEDAGEAVTLILWGLFKKLVISDNLTRAVAAAYDASSDSGGGALALATVMFALVVYGDFSAYTDIARGSALLFGVRLMRNFDAPYFAVSVRDFWRRWHISLSGWFRDYLYIPLGGGRRGTLRKCMNVMVVFAVSGLWHGAAGHFLIWGLLNGAYQVLETAAAAIAANVRNKAAALNKPDGGGELNVHTKRLLTAVKTAATFAAVNAAWVFFRADSVAGAVYILKKISASFVAMLGGVVVGIKTAYPTLAETAASLGIGARLGVVLLCGVIALAAVDLLSRKTDVAKYLTSRPALRYSAWFCLLAATLLFGAYGGGYDPSEFVYFQF